MSVNTTTIALLQLSRFNVRTNEDDANATAAIEASILARGLLYPLVVHPLAGSKKMGVLAGGRRYRAIRNLVDRGALPADWPIDILIRDVGEAELIELSLAENLIRRALRPYEVYAAVARAHSRGATLQEIADTNGQELVTIRRWLRLGNLADPIFRAFERGELTHDHASAFAATEDHRLQLSAFEAFAQLPHHARTDRAIRRLLKVGDEEEALLLTFVGERAYRDAGGAYELDLFADDAESRGRVGDPGLLRQLADEKLEAARTLLRARANRPIRFAADFPRAKYGGADLDLELTPTIEPLSPEQADRVEFLENELEELRDRLCRVEDAAAREAIEQEMRAADDELAAIANSRALILPNADIYATTDIDPTGQVEVRWWWASHKAKREATRTPETTADQRKVSAGPITAPAPTLGADAIGAGQGTAPQQQADTAARSEHGLTQEGVQISRSVRREMLRAILVGEFGRRVGHDYLIWQLARHEIAHDLHRNRIGARGLSRADDAPPFAMVPNVLAAVEATGAHAIWTAALAELRAHPSMTDPNLPDAFMAFVEADGDFRNLAAAAVAGMALTRSANLDGYRVDLHDMLSMAAEGDVELADLWAATETFVELLPRARRIELAEPFADDATVRNWTALKAAETVAPVTRALKRARWIHPALQFQTGDAPIAAEQAEAAE